MHFPSADSIELASSDPRLEFDHQMVIAEDAQMVLDPFLDPEPEFLPPKSCPEQHKETTPQDPSRLSLFCDIDISLFGDNVDIDVDHEDYARDVCPCARKDGSLKGFVIREVLDKW